MTDQVSCMRCEKQMKNIGNGMMECPEGHLQTLEDNLFPDLPMIEVSKGAYRYERNAKFVSPCPLPTPYECELLTILIEECAEVAQRATKMLRFGVEEIQPDQSFSNQERLSDEVGDLQCMIAKCTDEGLMSKTRIRDAHRKKWSKLKKYMQTSKEGENDH